MKTYITMLVILILCIPAYAVTFDMESDVVGSYWYSGNTYGVFADSSFRIADHSNSTWRIPHSGSNVLTSFSVHIPFAGMIKFGIADPYGFISKPIYSFGGYFSTQQGAIIEIRAYKTNGTPISAIVGAPGESWDNRWVDLSSAAGDIASVFFIPLSSDDALLHYCADDVSVGLVPEPSALLALGAGLAGIALRRRR